MAGIQDLVGGMRVDANGKAHSRLFDAFGNTLTKKHGGPISDANDEAILIGGRNDGSIRHMRMDRTGGQAIALTQPLFSEFFDGANVNPNRWLTTATTMTAVQTAALGLTLNSGNLVTNTVGYLYKTLTTFQRQARAILHAKFRFRANWVAGAVMEIGFGDATTFNGTHLNGCYLQVSAAGMVQLVWVKSGSPVTEDIGPYTGLLDPTSYYTADIILDDDQVMCVIQNTSNGLFIAEKTIFLPLNAPKHWDVTRISGFIRQFHASAPASAPQMIVSHFDVVSMDTNFNLTFGQQMAMQGLGSPNLPISGGQASNWANSAAPVSATLSNTAAGYTTLGGLFQFAAVAGAVTDYALFAFTVPAPFQFHCTGVEIDTWNTGAAVATTPTLLNWALGVDQSALSLATANISRVPLGAQSLPIGAVPGTVAGPTISKQFDTPLVINPGRFFTVILRMPIASATASQIVQGLVSINGFFK